MQKRYQKVDLIRLSKRVKNAAKRKLEAYSINFSPLKIKGLIKRDASLKLEDNIKRDGIIKR